MRSLDGTAGARLGAGPGASVGAACETGTWGPVRGGTVAGGVAVGGLAGAAVTADDAAALTFPALRFAGPQPLRTTATEASVKSRRPISVFRRVRPCGSMLFIPPRPGRWPPNPDNHNRNRVPLRLRRAGGNGTGGRPIRRGRRHGLQVLVCTRARVHH